MPIMTNNGIAEYSRTIIEVSKAAIGFPGSRREVDDYV
jgi:hypothetical protein